MKSEVLIRQILCRHVCGIVPKSTVGEWCTYLVSQEHDAHVSGIGCLNPITRECQHKTQGTKKWRKIYFFFGEDRKKVSCHGTSGAGRKCFCYEIV